MMKRTNEEPMKEQIPSTKKEPNNNKNYKGRSSSKIKSRSISEPQRKSDKNNYRPGFNSYLKVIMDPNSFDQLHATTLRIQKQLSSRSSSQDGGNKISIKPRSRSGLHMTFFFGGETLTSLPGPELMQWHQQIQHRFAHSNFHLRSGSDNEINTNTDDIHSQQQQQQQQQAKSSTLSTTTKTTTSTTSTPYYLQFRQFAIFPPRRNNLIVAIFDASDSMTCLYNDIRSIAMDASYSKDLQDVVQRSSKGPKWTAHVTLANIVVTGRRPNNKKKDLEKLAQLLDNVKDDDNNEMVAPIDSSNMLAQDTAAETKTTTTHEIISPVIGFDMGGPVPGQALLDWNFHYVVEEEK